MKLLVMKLASLFTCVAGLFVLALLTGFIHAGQLHAAYDTYAPPQVHDQLPFLWVEYAGAIALAVFGLYGFLPKLGGGKKKRTVAFAGDHGDVIVHLDTVESTLTRVLSNMPEVKRINVHVEADPKTNKAKIVANCVLKDRPDVPARIAADAVNEYLHDAAGTILGIEDVASVKLNVVGVDVDAKASSKFIETEHAKRVQLLEAKRLPPAPGLIAGAAALPEEPAVMPIVPSQANDVVEPFADIPSAEPAEDTANLNAADLRASENTDPTISTAFDSLTDEEKKAENEH